MPCTLIIRRLQAGLYGLLLLGSVAACGPASLPPGDSIPDAGEEQNRAVHQFNVALDRAVLGPASRGYGSALPEPLRRGVDNVAANLAQPSYIVNNLLQVRLGQATHNTLRFLVNSTIGLGGLFDPATAAGLDERETDFGETMHIWGLPEGDFVMLPLVGPSTTRDTVGLVMDIALNPVRHTVPASDRVYVDGLDFIDRFGDRYEMDATVDDILYDSADGYIQLRSLYLQNRRFELGGRALSYDTAGGAGDDSRADPYSDPYLDPYIDPYAQ